MTQSARQKSCFTKKAPPPPEKLGSRPLIRGARLWLLGCLLPGSLAVSPAEAQTPAFVSFPTSAQGITVREGRSISYTIRPSVAPTETVTVTTTGWQGTDVTLDKTTLTFTPNAWSAQTVTISAAWDLDQTNDAVTLVHTGSGGNYEDVTHEFPIRIIDNVQYYNIRQTDSSPAVGEGGTFIQQVHLTQGASSQPSADVTVTLTVADESVATECARITSPAADRRRLRPPPVRSVVFISIKL